MILQTLGTGQGYLKAGFLGFAKSGKTYTASLLAAGVKQRFGLEGPVVMFDTEGGSAYVASAIKRFGGGDLVGVRSRAFDDLMRCGRESVEIRASVLIVDSITHPWRELCDAHLRGINEVLKARGRPARQRLEFQDWAAIKTKWAPWTDFYLNSPLHIIICGRAGYEYDFEERDDGSGKDLVKTGIKMKTEGEFGFEPSLLVEMERVQELGDKTKIIHRATVLGDRFAVLDGMQADNPTVDFFAPHLDCLSPGAHQVVDTAVKSDPQVTEDGDSAWNRERKTRAILCEEIEGEMVRAWPGQTKDEKQAKLSALERAFGTRSWTAIEGMESDKLREGLTAIREMVERAVPTPTPDPNEV